MKKIFSAATILSLSVLIFSSFFFAKPAQAGGLVFVGVNDRGVYEGDGNHYIELYFKSNDPYKDCLPYYGESGFVTVWYSGNNSNVVESYAGASGFSEHICQVNVYAAEGAGRQTMRFNYYDWDDWYGYSPTQRLYYTFTF